MGQNGFVPFDANCRALLGLDGSETRPYTVSKFPHALVILFNLDLRALRDLEFFRSGEVGAEDACWWRLLRRLRPR